MRTSLVFASCFFCVIADLSPVRAQDAAATASAKVPLDHFIGTISAVDKGAQTVTIQEDKTAVVHLVRLADTKTILKVEPTAKDLKSAARITASDLEVGDRVDVRGLKAADMPTTINARSVILMSARALEQTHQQQAAAWAHSVNGVVTAIDAGSGIVTIKSAAPGQYQGISVKTSSATEFTRYSAEAGKAVPSQLSQIEAGDRIRVIGDKSEDGSTVTAQRLYSGAFRTISATVSSLGADGKSMTVKDLSTKKDVSVSLTADAAIHKLPPMMAGFLARRLNPSAAGAGAVGPPAGAGAADGPGGRPPAGAPDASTANAASSRAGSGKPNAGAQDSADGPGGPGFAAPGQGGPGDPGGPAGGGAGAGGSHGPAGRGDISQMIDRAPRIALTDLKPGDAVVISGVGSSGSAQLSANTVIAGVEPILQAAPQQRGGGRSVGGDWGLGEMSAPQ